MGTERGLAVQVRARCVAQFLALRAAGALPHDTDQTIRNLYWCATKFARDKVNVTLRSPQFIVSIESKLVRRALAH